MCSRVWVCACVQSYRAGKGPTSSRGLWKAGVRLQAPYPDMTRRACAGALYTMLGCPVMGAACAGWLTAAMQQQCADGGGGGAVAAPGAALGPEGGRRLLAAALRSPRLPRGRFDALVSDAAAIARGEESTDSLLAYEMQ